MAKKGKGILNSRIFQGAIMLLLGCAVAWAILTRFTSVLTTKPEEKVGTLSEVQTLATMNLDNSYPGTVDGVVTLFARITKAIYNEEYSDKELEKLCTKRYQLMDSELQDAQGSMEQYLASMKAEAKNKKDKNITISNYFVDDFNASSDIYTIDGDSHQYAKVNCRFVMREDSKAETYNYLFTMRKDTESGKNWKILGWEITLEDEATDPVTAICQRNLDNDYPENPKDVVEYFAYITTALYNESYSDAEFAKMSAARAYLYDDELLANQTDVDAQLKSEVLAKKDAGVVVAAFVVDDAGDFKYKYVLDDYCASGNCMFSMRGTSERQILTYQFILTKDSQGRWKIHGWEIIEEK
jgi:hypothetical protein